MGRFPKSMGALEKAMSFVGLRRAAPGPVSYFEMATNDSLESVPAPLPGSLNVVGKRDQETGQELSSLRSGEPDGSRFDIPKHPLSDGISDPTDVVPELSNELEGQFLLAGLWVMVRLGNSDISWGALRRSRMGGRIRRPGRIHKGWIILENVLAVERVPARAFCAFSTCCPGGFHKLVVHTFRRKRKKPMQWTPAKIVLCSQESSLIDRWFGRLNSVLAAKSDRPRKLLVFINPYGGARRAQEIWSTKVAPVFRTAGIKCSVVKTNRPNHARDLIAASADILKYDGIVAVGGDGLFQEILNGVLNPREKPVSDTAARWKHLRLGHIPAGSTDAVAWSLNGSRSAVSSALRIALGDRMKMDVMRVETGAGVPRFSACLAGYGFLGEITRISEYLRFMGPARYNIAGALVFVRGKCHKARVRYLPAGPSPPDSQSLCHKACDWCRTCSGPKGSDLGALSPDLTHVDTPNCALLQTIEGDFLSIMATVTTCRSSKSPSGVTPYAHLADGRMHLVLIRKCSHLEYLRFLVSLAKTGVTRGAFPFVETVDAKSVCIESLTASGHWNVDGELVCAQRLTIAVQNGLVQVFSRGIEF